MKRHLRMANGKFACGVTGSQFVFPSPMGDWVTPASLCEKCRKAHPGLTTTALDENNRRNVETHRTIGL
jgi:hypothetical protein